MEIYSQENAIENIICEMVIIFPDPNVLTIEHWLRVKSFSKAILPYLIKIQQLIAENLRCMV